MATENIISKNTLKSWFKRGLKPLESQFHAWMDSYWHKSELIPIDSVKGLEEVLNSRAENKNVNEITKGIEEHIKDTTAHKTSKEQNKLDNLADNPNETYVTKEELDNYTPVVFYATYTDDVELGSRSYTISDDQKKIMVDYFENNITAPVILHTENAENPAKYENYIMTSQECSGVYRTFYFSRISPPVPGVSYNSFFSIKMQYMCRPNGTNLNFRITNYTYSFDESEYKKARYLFTDRNFDMNDLIESGGIVATIIQATEGNTGTTGLNLPEGFTNINGCVLADTNGCTQIITDLALQKIMIRCKRSGGTWTNWCEIGKTEPYVYIVSEYPIDLSNYPDGTIFIKQQAL